MDTNDRRLREFRPPPRPDPELPYYFPDVDEAEYDDHKRRRPPIHGQRFRNHNFGFREQLPNTRAQRGNPDMFVPRTDPYTQRDYHQSGHFARQTTCWDSPAVRQAWYDPPIRHQKLGLQRYDQPRQRQPSCWAPPQGRQTFCWETPVPPSDGSSHHRCAAPPAGTCRDSMDTSHMNHQRVWSPLTVFSDPCRSHHSRIAVGMRQMRKDALEKSLLIHIRQNLTRVWIVMCVDMRDQDEDDSCSSSLVATIGYSCENTREFDYYSKRRMVEDEHCENLGSMLLMDSTEVEEVCGHNASNSDATGVSISSIALLGDNHGVEEDRAVSPEGHQVSASKEIYLSCSSDENNILSTAPLPAAALFPDVDGDFKCFL